MTDFNKLLQERLQQRRDQQRYRWRHSRQTPQGPLVTIDDREMINFSGNDYLGLANHPKVIESLRAAAIKAGVGSGASHLVYGHSDHHHQLELALAEFTGRERALLFSTGYMANLGVIAALVARNDTVFQDRLNHASLIDGGLLSRAQFKRFRHNDTEQLKNQLASTEQGLKLVVVDGVFSMDGDLAPLPELASICQAHQGLLMVDDAHGFGVLGSQGGGCAQHFQLSPDQLPVLVGTLGKSFGTFGAFVAGSELLIENLIQFARPYIYTTALPPALCAATLTSLGLMKQENWRRLKLAKLIAQFRSGAQAMGLPLMETFTPIQPVVLGEDDILLEVAAKLKAANILVGAIRPPTVPEGSARLRITLSAAHSEEQVAQLLKVLDGSVPLSRRQ